MYRVYKKLLEGFLDKWYKEDQAERESYQSYIDSYKDPELATVKFAKDHKRKIDDLFNNKDRYEKVKTYIKKNIEEIKISDSLKNKCLLLVRDMREDLEFQMWFLSFLNKDSEEYTHLKNIIEKNSK
jgi:hypothetical protein